MTELEKQLTVLEQQRKFVCIETFVDGRLTGKFLTLAFTWGHYGDKKNCYDLWIGKCFITVKAEEISVDLERNLITVNYRCVISTG